MFLQPAVMKLIKIVYICRLFLTISIPLKVVGNYYFFFVIDF